MNCAWHDLFHLHRQDARDELLDAWALTGEPFDHADEHAAVMIAARQFVALVEVAAGIKLDPMELTEEFLRRVKP